MKSLKGTQTEKNLLAAFAGEAQARNRYEFYAKVADQEGYKQIAAIFLETATDEISHSKSFYKFLEGGDVEITARFQAGKIGTTAENLRAACSAENEEWSNLYQQFAKTAEEEGFLSVAASFRNIAKVEEQHEKRFRKLLDRVEKAEVFKRDQIIKWRCRKCGYIVESQEAPKACAACSHPQSYFEEYAENY